ncbi:MAG: site-specific DNA-methyltransferase [Chloroflexi bacterium]|nr:site-specific DNA-methyltransferase [Chloroflexota bacterium]
MVRRRPGEIRDAIRDYLEGQRADASVSDIRLSVAARLGDVAASSVRSYLRLNAGDAFVRTSYGRYGLRSGVSRREVGEALGVYSASVVRQGRAELWEGDCLAWLENRPERSVHAVVTDPPYGLLEYTPEQQAKLRDRSGGVWRIPPSFDGHERSPVPRFTVLKGKDLAELERFFHVWALRLYPVLVPGANVLIASNPLLSCLVSGAVARAGFERRGEIVRLVMTMRGGDRPKNAHEEFPDVSVMPRSMWEPWLLFRKPLEGRVQDNLRTWGTGGLRRISPEQPFGDVIQSRPTSPRERRLAPHPSLKPQAFLRQIVRAALPQGNGIVLDPFAGSGSTLAAAEAIGYQSIGVEQDPHYFRMAGAAIPQLASFQIERSNQLSLRYSR